MIRRTLGAALALALVCAPSSLFAQDASTRVVRLVPSAEQLSVPIGEQVSFSVTAVDAAGNEVPAPIRIIGPRNAVQVSDGQVEGLAQGGAQRPAGRLERSRSRCGHVDRHQARPAV